jgi:hypothetical protein
MTTVGISSRLMIIKNKLNKKMKNFEEIIIFLNIIYDMDYSISKPRFYDNIIDPCQTCGRNHAKNMCMECFRIRYCDIHCAEKDYMNHKLECRLWSLSSKDINNDVINNNYVIKIIIENIKDWHFHLLMGSTCKSWRGYIKSLYIIDETHKLYYTDDNLIGVIYSLKRKNPAYIGDAYSIPIYEAMSKSGKPSYSVLKYINYANEWHLEYIFLAYRLCEYGSDELYNCLDICLKPCLSTPIYIDIEVSIAILIEYHLVKCEEKHKRKNIAIIEQIIHKKYGKNSNNYNKSLIDRIEKIISKYNISKKLRR